MNPFGAIKRWAGMVFTRAQSAYWSLWRSAVPWYSRVWQTSNSSVVAVTIMWCARNFPEAPPALWLIRPEDGQLDPVKDHPLIRLLRRPNEYHSGELLWMATITDWKMSGNAYWLIVRDQTGLPAELWWAPSWMVEPIGSPGNTSVYIDHYQYTPNNDDPIRIDPNDVVHFRWGLDGMNPRKGCSPLLSVLREVFTDDEAAKFTATILTNMGVPGVVISPDPSVKVTDEDIRQAKADFQEEFSGERRGGPMVMKGATKVEQFGFSPKDLLLTEIRRVPEERVTAALGVPAVVVGLGAGLDRSTFTNMGEALEYAYSNGLIPDQRIMASVVHWSLLTEYMSEDEAWGYEFGFDLSRVRALQEDSMKLAQRWNSMVFAGYAMVKEARRATGLEVDETRDAVFLRPANYTMVDAETGEITTLRATTLEQSESGGQEPDGANPGPGQPAPAGGNGGAHADDVSNGDRKRLLEITEGGR